MINRSSWKGAITVYLSIILSSVILLSGVLIDIARIKTAEIQVRRAVNTAALSALAGYQTKLKEDYGLFALHNNDSSQIEGVLRSYLSKNLSIDFRQGKEDQTYSLIKNIIINDKYRNVDFIDIYDYKIESVSTLPIYNLTENEITRQQIVEYMKYRAPAQFAENFIEKINYVSSTSDMTAAYKQKTKIEKQLAKIEKSLIRLQNYIDNLNNFNKAYFDNAQGSESLVKAYIEYEVQSFVYSVYSSTDIETADNDEDEKKAEEISLYAAELYDTAVQNSKEVYKQLEEHIADCITAARNAVAEINSIKAVMESTRAEIDVLKRSLQEMEKDSTGESTEIIAVLKQDIEKWEQLLGDEDSSSKLKQLENNIEVLCIIDSKIKELSFVVQAQSRELRSKAADNMKNALKDSGSLDVTGTEEFKAAVIKVLAGSEAKIISASSKDFEKINAVLTKSNKAKGRDPREAIENGAKEIMNEVSTSVKRIEEPELLPSYNIDGAYPNKILSEALLYEEADEVGAAASAKNLDINFEQENSFTEDTFGFINDLASKLKQYVKDKRNELYINEYILAIFKDEVEIEEASTDDKVKDTLFEKGEVEYILAGFPSEPQNHLIVKGEVLLIRFCMDTLHVYSDANKRLRALEIATAIAGITGFGIPIVHNLVMCAWGMAEAFQDTRALYEGKRVPFIKTSDTWRTDLKSGGYSVKDDVQEKRSLMDFDYHDYLRLLLLVEDKELKMNRVEDLIQINMQKNNSEFMLRNYNTYIKVNVQVSIKYWFLTKIFVPSKLKTPDGRHRIIIEAWKGY